MSDYLMKRAFLFARNCWVFIHAWKKPEYEFKEILRSFDDSFSSDDEEAFEYDYSPCRMRIINGAVFNGTMELDRSNTVKFKIECKTDKFNLGALDVDNIEENIPKVRQTEGELIGRYGIYLDDYELEISKAYDFQGINIVSGISQIRDDIIGMARLYQKLIGKDDSECQII